MGINPVWRDELNPVMSEMAAQVAAQVMGNDLPITIGGQGGHLELNAMMPLMAANLLSLPLYPLLRDGELDLLLRGWARAKMGEGQVVLVSGETSIGKSDINDAQDERPRSRDDPAECRFGGI